MKHLTLIRHAKSSWADGDLDDFDRPLNGRGRRDAPVMAERFAARRPLPERILASPAVRAAETARAFASAAHLDDALVFEERLYLASPGQMLGIAQDVEDAVGHLALVGHNPGTTQLLDLLADAGVGNVPTCGVARLELEIERWRDAAPGCGRLLALDTPKKPAGD